MSLLSTIAKPAPRPPIITVVGEVGTGKSSFAATFPKPIFIRAEDGVGRISRKIGMPDAFPVVDNSEDLFEQILALLKEEHDYSTIVIDSVTKLEEIFTREILEKDGRAKTLSTALGGYGAGYQALAGMHARVRKAAGALNDKRKMAVVFIAHADLETMRLPDTDDYQRHSLRLSSKSIAPYVDDVDVVGFVRLATALRGDDGERKKVVSTGDREFVCHATAASVSKNGLGITAPLPFVEGTNPLADALGITQRMKPAAKAEKKETVE
jgi:GTPase SAR1 family protein